MLFDKKVKPGDYEVSKEGREEIIKFNYNNYPYTPSIEDSPFCMTHVIEALSNNPSITRIIFNQIKNYEYNYEQTQMLVEIANVYSFFMKQKQSLMLSSLGTGLDCTICYPSRHSEVQNILINLLRTDPLGAYIELKRLIREETIKLKGQKIQKCARCIEKFLTLVINIHGFLEKTKLVSLARPYLDGYHLGDRTIYRRIFHPIIRPDFIATRLMTESPLDAEELDSYSIDKNTDVSIFRLPNEIKPLYLLNPPEYKISEDKYELLELAKGVLMQHKPKAEEFIDPERIRKTFFNIGRDLLTELADHKNLKLTYKELEELADILVRYTIGFGLIEVLLKDKKIQDISINSPMGETPIFIVHSDYEECRTNLIPSPEDAESWATKFRITSGRPLDEANPVLDTELILPDSRTRVAIISRPLNPYGLAYSFRRHRDRPWTLPLFIQNKMINPLAAGLLSFLVDGSRTFLVAGTRGTGKTSLLDSFLFELMRKYRLITIEDTLELSTDALRSLGYNIQPMKVRAALMSKGTEIPADEGIRTSLRMGDSSLIVGEIRSSIRGNEEVLIIEDGITKRIQIKELEGKDISKIYVPSMDFDLKFKLKKLLAFIKHPKREKLLEVTTRTGRKITVTPDHSLFTNKDFKIVPIECQSLKIGDKVIIPEKLPSNYNNIKSINLLELLEDKGCRLINYEEDLRQIIHRIGYKEASKLSNCNQDIYQYLRRGIQHTNITISDYKTLAQEAKYNINPQILQIKKGTSKTLDAEIEISNNFCRFLGYYLAEGYTQKIYGNVIFSNGNKFIINDIINLSKNLFNIKPYVRTTKGLGISTQIILRNKILALLIEKIGCGRTALEKRVPSIIFGLSEEKICEFLRGYFDGDGSQTSTESSGNRIACSTISKGLANDLLYLLLQLGIVGRVYTKQITGIGKHTQYILEFKQRKYVNLFKEKIGFKKYKKDIINRSTSHSNLNTVDYDLKVLEQHIKLNRKYRHLRKYTSCGKEYLKNIVENSSSVSDTIKTFVNGEFYIDEVKSIKEINLDEGEYVYDLSVEPCQNFIGGFGGIMLHNTEAFALYEAMRIGALANVVAGTIHGDSPYGVFDRVVNDLKVPRTSFKATDIIVVANQIRSPDGMHRYRRVTQITEVRKTWEKDPLKENGFVDLMKYNAKTDSLQPTDNLINGDSEIIKAIAGNVREWAGNWDAVWENILLRARMKDTLVKYAEKVNMPELLEAKHIVHLNDAFHQITDEIKEKKGFLDSKLIYLRWEQELKDYLKRKLLLKQ